MIVKPLSPRERLVGIVASACLVIGCTLGVCNSFKGQNLLQRIDCGEGREILITAARAWEAGRTYFYVVRVNGKVVVPTDGLGVAHPDEVEQFRFEKHWLVGRDVVAIFESSQPDRFVIIHDFRNNASWPRQHVSPLSKFGPLTGLDLSASENRARIEAAYAR